MSTTATPDHPHAAWEPSAELLAKLRLQYPAAASLHLLRHEGEPVVVQAPPPMEWRRFQASASDKDRRSMALGQLTRSCLVYTPHAGDDASYSAVAAAYDKILGRWAGLGETFGNSLCRIAGLAGEAEEKKL